MRPIYPLLMIILVIGIPISCKKEIPPPSNWKTTTTTVTNNVAPVSSSLLGLHTEIFSTKCALPGCHDGHFEPDFRTVESSYSTLVWHGIIKNNLAEDYRYRVVPFDTTASVLYQRITNCCFVNTNDRMPNDNIGSKLPQKDITNIATWILEGARNSQKNNSAKPDKYPEMEYMVALDNANTDSNYFNQYHRDNQDWNNPAHIPYNTDILWGVVYKDDFTAFADFSESKLLFSTNKNNFTNARNLTIPYENWYGWHIFRNNINTNTFNVGDTIYVRSSVNDGQHSTPFLYPNEESPYWAQTVFSFVVDP